MVEYVETCILGTAKLHDSGEIKVNIDVASMELPRERAEGIYAEDSRAIDTARDWKRQDVVMQDSVIQMK